jgi:hypothetical protein
MVAGGFSVTTTINSYLIQDADDPMRFHALITAGWINSVSLTPIPACPDALVWDRIPAAPGSNVINLINQFKQSLSQLREITA